MGIEVNITNEAIFIPDVFNDRRDARLESRKGHLIADVHRNVFLVGWREDRTVGGFGFNAPIVLIDMSDGEVLELTDPYLGWPLRDVKPTTTATIGSYQA